MGERVGAAWFPGAGLLCVSTSGPQLERAVQCHWKDLSMKAHVSRFQI